MDPFEHTMSNQITIRWTFQVSHEPRIYHGTKWDGRHDDFTNLRFIFFRFVVFLFCFALVYCKSQNLDGASFVLLKSHWRLITCNPLTAHIIFTRNFSCIYDSYSFRIYLFNRNVSGFFSAFGLCIIQPLIFTYFF